MLSKEFLFAIDGRTNRRDDLKFLLLHLTFVVVATILGSNLSDMFISNASGAATTVTYPAAFLICGIAPGTKGVNRYGSPIVSRWTGSPSAEQSGQLGS